MRPFFKDDDFNFLTEIALGSVYRQAADVGEVLTTSTASMTARRSRGSMSGRPTADRLAKEAADNAGGGLGEGRHSGR
jgi:hypothetical protein